MTGNDEFLEGYIIFKRQLSQIVKALERVHLLTCYMQVSELSHFGNLRK
jgi:hypothetical protein